MNIDPNKVIDAIAALKDAAEALLIPPHELDIGKLGKIAGECIKSAAALQASCQIAGLTHRTFHTVGDLQ